LNKVEFDSMAFQERNGTCGMKPERSRRNLAKKSGTDRDLKWDEICSVLFRFLNWYGIFRSFQAKRNGIDNLVGTPQLSLVHLSLRVPIQSPDFCSAIKVSLLLKNVRKNIFFKVIFYYFLNEFRCKYIKNT